MKKTVSFIHLFSVITVVILLVCTGCSISQKPKRGHLIRCEWAIEHNRTPWIGCPPTSGYDDGEDSEDDGKSGGLFKCLKGGKNSKKKGFRWHCGQRSECTAQQPCCKTLGCGMWVDPSDPSAFASLGGGAKACGLTPFCTPMKPCGLTANCGKPVNINVNPQALMLANQGGSPLNPMMSGAVLPSGIFTGGNGGAVPNQAVPQGAAMQGSLVSKGIVPGISTVSTGGVVAAIGVATPVGTMTTAGVRLPNGAVNPNIVLRACGMSPNCTAAHPCGLAAGCGTAVPLAMVSNNATTLASALMTQGSASGVAQIGTMVNPITNQPISGLTMNGFPQAGYPPIGYSPTGYAPGYPRFDGNVPVNNEEAAEEEPTAEEEAIAARQSNMPVPRFHPVPSKPVFQRSEGMQPTPKPRRNQSAVQQTSAVLRQQAEDSDAGYDEALDEAYLEGVSAAMSEVQREMAYQEKLARKKELQTKIARQSQSIQQQVKQVKQTEPVQEPAVPRLPAPEEIVEHKSAVKQNIKKVLVVEELPQPKMVVPVVTAQEELPAEKPAEKLFSIRRPPEQDIDLTDKSLLSSVKSLKNGFASGINGLFAPPKKAAVTPQQAVAVQPEKQVKSKKTDVSVLTPSKPQTYKKTPQLGLESDSEDEPMVLVQQAQYEREIPRP